MTRAIRNRRLRRILAEGNGGERYLESAGDPDAIPHVDDLMNKVDIAVRKAPTKAANADVARALLEVGRHGTLALDRLRRDQAEALTTDETFALEAIVRLDGSRPSLLLRKGRSPDRHPLLGRWGPLLAEHAGALSEVANAIGRIEPDDGSASNYFGTGFLINAQKGLVLTNRHVLDGVLERPSTQQRRDGAWYRFYGGVRIDLAGESQSLEQCRCKIVEARPARVNGFGFRCLDIAVMRIEPLDGIVLPRPIKLEIDLDAALGTDHSPICLIGYSGPPQYDRRVGTIDWEWINKTLMGGIYGVKRLAPGYVHLGLGSDVTDLEKWVIGHDASTLGGNSGSPVISFRRCHAAFAIHFAGQLGSSNYAHACTERVAAELVTLGVQLA